MEADEETKRHDSTFTLHNILFIVHVSAGLAVAGYCSYPTVVTLLEGFILWFDWFRFVLRNIFFIFIILNALIGSIYFTFLKATEKNKPSPHNEYITAVPSVIPSSPESSFSPTEVGDYYGGGVGYYNSNSSYMESVQPFHQAVNTVEQSSCYERVVVEANSKGCKRTTEKKMRKVKSTRTVEYHHQRKETERVMKTASLPCRSQVMMDGMSSEEFRMTVETFIMEKKKMYDWRTQWQNGDPNQLQNGVAYQRQNGFPQLQNDGVYQWQNGVQNDGVYQWQNCVPQLQGQDDYGGSGSTCGEEPYSLAISN